MELQLQKQKHKALDKKPLQQPAEKLLQSDARLNLSKNEFFSAKAENLASPALYWFYALKKQLKALHKQPQNNL